VDQGNFASAAKEHPYPSRAFAYLFELEANREHHLGKLVDFSPLDYPSNLYSFLIQQHNQWYERNGVELRRPALPKEYELFAKGAEAIGPTEALLLIRDTTWQGFTRDWGFKQRFDQSGYFVEQYWLFSIMRLWQAGGRVQYNPSSGFEMSTSKKAAFSFTVVKLGTVLYAIDANGTCLFQFRVQPNAT
jgi:hypothetical protein